jgi:hypothetical protein
MSDDGGIHRAQKGHRDVRQDDRPREHPDPAIPGGVDVPHLDACSLAARGHKHHPDAVRPLLPSSSIVSIPPDLFQRFMSSGASC